MKTLVRVNGVGSAWPVMIGETHPVYSTGRLQDLSNASYSLINYKGNEMNPHEIEWQVMIDMGHYTIPFLISKENRIPEIVALTHGHADHFFGIDWVVQSYYTKYGIKKKYPIYTTKAVWETVLKTFSYLGQIAELKELHPGEKMSVDEISGLTITAIPVFHGESAFGASMLYFENEITGMKPVLFTGDLLCPLWRKKDISTIREASQVFIDCTNRFPCPGYNHMSFTSQLTDDTIKFNLLSDWIKKNDFSNLLAPHIPLKTDLVSNKYFEEFLNDWKNTEELTFSITGFIKQAPIPSVKLVHYAGTEDRKFYNQLILGRNELEEWAAKTAMEEGIKNTKFCFPEVGQVFDLINQ